MIRLLAFGLVTAASLYGQAYGHPRFNWQNYCFDHPASPVCPSHEFYDKRPAPPKATPSPSVVTNLFPSPRQEATASPIVVGGIDWRFADPSADALVGFNFSALSASPLARKLIAQLGVSQGLTGVDMRKILDGLSGVDQVALSVRDNRIVIMVTSETNSTLPTLEAGWKAVPVSGNVMLIGHADAVDEAVRRIAMKGPLDESARLSEERQTNNEFWAAGSAGFVGAQAVRAGLRRFALTVSLRNRLASDLAFEFNGPPNAGTLRIWPVLDGGSIEGNVVHVRMPAEAKVEADADVDEVPPRFGQIAGSPLGQRLAALVMAARYLPVRDTTVPKQTKPVIYGLDGGPRVQQ
jgi:hypothetical protein